MMKIYVLTSGPTFAEIPGPVGNVLECIDSMCKFSKDIVQFYRDELLILDKEAVSAYIDDGITACDDCINRSIAKNILEMAAAEINRIVIVKVVK